MEVVSLLENRQFKFLWPHHVLLSSTFNVNGIKGTELLRLTKEIGLSQTNRLVSISIKIGLRTYFGDHE
jgi:hypothetical protein